MLCSPRVPAGTVQMVFSPQHESWRKHPMLQAKYRNMYVCPSTLLQSPLRQDHLPVPSQVSRAGLRDCHLCHVLCMRVGLPEDQSQKPPPLMHVGPCVTRPSKVTNSNLPPSTSARIRTSLQRSLCVIRSLPAVPCLLSPWQRRPVVSCAPQASPQASPL